MNFLSALTTTMSSKLIRLLVFIILLSCNDSDENKRHSFQERLEFATSVEYEVSADSAASLFRKIFDDFRNEIDDHQAVLLHNKIAENYISINLALSKSHLDSALLIGISSKQNIDELGSTFDALGIYYEKLQKFDSGLYHIEKGLNFRLENLALDDLEISNSYLSLAYHYGNVRQEFDKAFDYAEKALAIRSAKLGKDHLSTGECYSNLAFYYNYYGDHEKALNYQLRSLELLNQTEANNNDFLLAYENMGAILKSLNRLSESLVFYRKVLMRSNMSVNPLKIALIYSSIAEIMNQVNPDSSSYYLQKSSNIYYQELQQDHPFIGTINGQIGNYLSSQTMYDSALNHYYIAKEIFAQNADSDPVTYANTLTTIGEVYLAKSQLEQAIYYVDQAMALYYPDVKDQNYGNSEPSIKSNKVNLYRVLQLRGKTLAIKGDLNSLKLALDSYSMSINYIEALKKGYSNDHARERLSNITSEIFDQAIQTSIRIYRKTGDKKYLEIAFEFAEKNRAFSLISAVKDSKAKHFASIPSEIIDKEEQLKRDLTFYRNRVFLAKQNSNKEEAEKYQNLLFSTERNYDSLLTQLEINYPRYYELKNQSSHFSTKELQENLQADEALIEYFVGGKEIQAFLVTKSNLKVFTIPKDSAFDQNIKRFYISINKYQKDVTARLSNLLYKQLVEPFSKQIPDGVTKLSIVPHNELAYISFDCLSSQYDANPQEMRYLIEDFEIKYHYSAKLAFEKRNNTGNLKEIALYAPVFDQYNPDKLQPLPGSEMELKNISMIFEEAGLESDVFMRGDATKSGFQKKSNDRQIIHLATHTLIDREAIRNSKMYFSKNQGSDEDNILRLSETYNIKLNADLLTLSSCESGTGKLAKGEGVLSFTRGFSFAGAENINCSLWKVNDFYASEIMRIFYRELLNKKSFAASLRNAKLSVLKNKSNAPKDWAGFILIAN
ncbi:MAG: CHAT domain-containing tetratricopeptide repeat protein [Bacteroidota bacterium]